MNKDTTRMLERLINIFELFIILMVLTLAFSIQIIFHELPCPLCLLQRIGFLFVAYGFVMNLRFGFHPSHYAITLLSALFTSFVALRQIALHVIPGTGAYGDPVFGFHLYTWSFIIATVILVVTSFMVGVERQYVKLTKPPKIRWYAHVLFFLLTVVILMNIVSVLMECGLGMCPDNPVHYLNWWSPLSN